MHLPLCAVRVGAVVALEQLAWTLPVTGASPVAARALYLLFNDEST